MSSPVDVASEVVVAAWAAAMVLDEVDHGWLAAIVANPRTLSVFSGWVLSLIWPLCTPGAALGPVTATRA